MIRVLLDEQASVLMEQAGEEYHRQQEASRRFGAALNELHAAKIESSLAWAAFVSACGDAPTAMGLMEWAHDTALEGGKDD